jgi:hypothetical protein
MDGGGRRKGVYDVLADSELKELSSWTQLEAAT